MLDVHDLKRRQVKSLMNQSGRDAPWIARGLTQRMGRSIIKQSVYQWLESTSPRDEAIWDAMIALLSADLAARQSDVVLPIPTSEAQGILHTRYELGASITLPVWLGVLAADEEECYYDVEQNLMEEVPIFLLGPHKPDECFLIRAAGSSASPRIEHAETALCRRASMPPINTLVVASRLDGAKFVKALRSGAPPIPYRLDPLNPHYVPITEVRGWSFDGSVIAILKSPEPGKPNIEWNYGMPLRA